MKKIDFKKIFKILPIDITIYTNLLITAIFMLFLTNGHPESINIDLFFEVIENNHLLKELLFLLLGSFVWFQLFQFISLYEGDKK